MDRLDSVNTALQQSQKRLLKIAGGAWVGVGAIAGIWFAGACVAEDGESLGMVNAWCLELALFGFVCWAILGVILVFPLYYWLVQHNRAKTPR